MKKPAIKKREKSKETKKIISKKVVEKLKPERYFEAVGRRKTAVARVRLFTRGEKVFLVNKKPLEAYFSTLTDISSYRVSFWPPIPRILGRFPFKKERIQIVVAQN